MDFDQLAASNDAKLISALGGSKAATVHPRDLSQDFAIPGIIKNPAMEEDFIPGSSQGVSVVRFFVQLSSLEVIPQKGDTATLNGIEYDVFDVIVDQVGGATLKLRKKNV